MIECDDAEDTEKAVEAFRSLLHQEPDLEVRTDDNFILRNLRASEGDPEKAFAKMKTFYQLKRDYPEWYAADPPIMYKDVLEMGSDYILEDRDKTGKRIWINKPGKVDTSRTTISRQSQMHDLLLEMILDEPETQKHGVAVIVDLKDFSWSLLRWFTPANVKICTKKADSLPFPKLEYHVVNTSIFFNITLKIVYPFLSAKQKENLFIHGDNWASLHEKIDPSILPEEYGGEKPNTTGEKLHTQVYDYTEKLLVNFQMGYKDKNDDRKIIQDLNSKDSTTSLET